MDNEEFSSILKMRTPSTSAENDIEDNTNNQSDTVSSSESSIKDTIAELLNESSNRTDSELIKAALDAVRFEHQRLQNEFMVLVSLNDHIQQKIEVLRAIRDENERICNNFNVGDIFE